MEMESEEKEEKRLEKQLEDELGDDYLLDLNKHKDLAVDEWKYDKIPQLWEGHNVADFIDPDILMVGVLISSSFFMMIIIFIILSTILMTCQDYNPQFSCTPSVFFTLLFSYSCYQPPLVKGVSPLTYR